MNPKPKLTKLIIGLTLFGSAHHAMAQKAPEYPGYTLAWQDEFNGDKLDEDAWNIEVNGDGGGNNELQYYTRKNVTIENEPSTGARCLTLTAKRENYKGKSFTSGRLNTLGKVFFTRGRIESRIMMPKTKNGLWPAFWMMGNDFRQVGWPRCGEIDIVEMGNAQGIANNTQTRFLNGACHWGFYKNGGYPNYAKHTTNAYDIQDGTFHLFTCIWDENFVRFYLDLDRNPDAKPYFEIAVSDTSGEWSTGNYFQKANFIIYDLAVGGNFTGINNQSKITALPNQEVVSKMYIDWVRVYQNDSCLPITYPSSFTFGHEDEGKIPGTGIIDNEDHSGIVQTDPVKVGLRSAPTPVHDASQVLSIYSDSYSSAAPNMNFNDWTSSSNRNSVGTDVVNRAGDNFFRITNFAWYGIEYGKTIDTSAFDYLHVDLFSTKDGTVDITPITGDKEQSQTVEIAYGKWTSHDISVKEYVDRGMNMAKNYQIKLAGNSGGTLYIDNVYFWKDTSDGILKHPDINSGNTKYYNLQGISVSGAHSGIIIKRTLMPDGKIKTEKILNH